MQFISDRYVAYKTVFPFNVFFGTIDLVTNYSSSFATKSLNFTLAFPDFATSSVSLLTPTFFKDNFGVLVTSVWYNAILSIVSVVMLYTLYRMII